MSEGNAAKFQGNPISASVNTVSFRNAIPKRNSNAKYNTYHLTITKGRGLGQVVEVLSSKGNTYTLKDDWKVIPDSTSAITVNSGTHYLIVYDNDFTQKTYIPKAHYGIASAAVEPFGGCSHWITDKNKFIGFKIALYNFPTKHEIGYDPNFWMEWNNNYIDGQGGGQGYISHLVKDGFEPGPKILGDLIRRNTVINVQTAYGTESSRANSGYDKPVMEYVVAEHNIMKIPMRNINSPGMPAISPELVSKQVLYKNR